MRWQRAAHSPYATTRWVTHVATSAQLRQVVEAARADPHVTGYRYQIIHTMQGEPPTQCRRGHRYAGGSATRPVLGWAPCAACPGHEVYHCRRHDATGQCADVLLDPAPGGDCAPTAQSPHRLPR